MVQTQIEQDQGNIDLMGWDTVFALSLDALNSSIVSQNTTPAGFEATDPTGGAAVQGSWDAWSVIGGEGDGIYVKCPVRTGTMTVGSETYKLDGSTVVVMITLAQHSDSTELKDPTAKAGTGTTKLFKANASTEDPFQQPKVQPPTDPPTATSSVFPGVTGYLVYAAVGAFTAYFNANIGAFDAVFAAVRLEETAIEAGKQWLKPQVSLYAMASAGDDESDAYFGILSLTSPLKDGEKLPQQNFDERMFSYFTKTETPTNSVFAVSAPLAMQNIIQQSAVFCVKSATMDDFEITNGGITVTNKNELHWGDFAFDKDRPDEVVTPVIPAAGFQLSLDGTNFHLSISNAAFTTPDGTADVKITADQFFNFSAAKLKDGNYYFTPGKGLGTNSIRADVSPNKGFQIAMIIDSIAVGVAFGFIGAGLGEALGDALSSSTTAAGDGLIEGTANSIEDGLNNLGEEGLENAVSESIQDAGDAISSGGENTGGRTGIFANKFKVFGGMLGGMLGIPVGLLPQIMTAIYTDQITTGNVPTLDDFATHFTGAVQWPEVKSWEVTGGTFASAFMLAGHAGAQDTHS